MMSYLIRGFETAVGETVQDVKNKLIWKQNLEDLSGRCGCLFSFKEAKEIANLYCSVGYRLPTLEELISILDYSSPNGNLSSIFYLVGGFVWSSTSDEDEKKAFYGIDFWTGKIQKKEMTERGYVRLVKTM